MRAHLLESESCRRGALRQERMRGALHARHPNPRTRSLPCRSPTLLRRVHPPLLPMLLPHLLSFSLFFFLSLLPFFLSSSLHSSPPFSRVFPLLASSCPPSSPPSPFSSPPRCSPPSSSPLASSSYVIFSLFSNGQLLPLDVLFSVSLTLLPQIHLHSSACSLRLLSLLKLAIIRHFSLSKALHSSLHSPL